MSTTNHKLPTILLIGHGNMGSALAARWKHHDLHIIDPNAPDSVPHVKQISELPAGTSPDVIVLAVKPQQLDALLPQLAENFSHAPLYLSIAAGKRLAYYNEMLGQGARVVRAMPNTPAMVGQGMTVLAANANVGESEKETAYALMACAGQALWLEEAQMDAATAISGSGPAYFFSFMASLVEAAVAQGLSPDVAETLVKQTALGAATLTHNSRDGLCTLADRVTSKGGTTEAARKIFEEHEALGKLVAGAVAAAVARAGEL